MLRVSNMDVDQTRLALSSGRAAGSALRRCPVEILVPCHRVVGAGRGLGGYGGHDDRKRSLLRLEGAV